MSDGKIMPKVDPEKLAEFCVRCAEDKLADDVVCIPVGKVSSVADLNIDEPIDVRFADGSVRAVVRERKEL